MDLILEPLTPYESNVVVMLMMCFMRWRWCLRRACSAGRHLRAVCPGGTGDELFRQMGDKLRHLHIVDSDGASDTHTFLEKAKCRCGN